MFISQPVDDASLLSDDSSSVGDISFLSDLSTSPSLDDCLPRFKGQPLELDAEEEQVFQHLQPLLTEGNIHINPAFAAVDLSNFYDTKLLLRTARPSAHLVEGEYASRVFPVLIDTGCSVACTGYESDFDGVLIPGEFGSIKTANGTASIAGFGMVAWHTLTEMGEPVTINVPAYYCPEVQLRLFSPQDYARYHKMTDRFPTMNGTHAWFSVSHKDSTTHKRLEVMAGVEPQSQLFFFYAENRLSPERSDEALDSHDPSCPHHTHAAHSAAVHNPKNHNLSTAQKAVLLDHQRLGHYRMQLIQSLYKPPPDDSPLFLDDPEPCRPVLQPSSPKQLGCTAPMCATCQFAKARKRPNKHRLTQDQPPVLQVGNLEPGDCFSTDQYESSVRGRLPQTRGRERSSNRYVGGTIFFDHASSKIYIRHQTSLSGKETVMAKRDVERECLSQGVIVKSYQSDNGIYAKSDFEKALLDNNQTLFRCGVGAKHQNGIAERAIGLIQNMARAMLLHLRLHWPDEFDPNLWPFAMDYAVWIYNQTPQSGRAHLSPDELFSKTRVVNSYLRRARVFGSPTYVLDARLQDGKKIPKWKPRSRLGMFLGFSPEHSSTVAQVMNVRTGYVSPQFHVVFDERFETVASEHTLDLSETWFDLWQHARESYLDEWDITVDGPFPTTNTEYESDSDSESSSSNDDDDFGNNRITGNPPLILRDSDAAETWQEARETERPSRSTNTQGVHEVEETPTPTPTPTRSPERPARISIDPRPAILENEDSDSSVESVTKRFAPDREPLLEPNVNDEEVDTHLRDLAEDLNINSRSRSSSSSDDELSFHTVDNNEDESESEDEELPSPRHTRSGKAFAFSPTNFKAVSSRAFSHVKMVTDKSNLAYVTLDWETVDKDSLYSVFDDMFKTHVDRKTQEILDPNAAFHPFALAAKVESEDYPTFKEILRMDPEERDKWFAAMDEEMQTLFGSGACEFVDREEVLRLKKEIVKSTWSQRKKRDPSGRVSRYKSRLCVRGDLQRDSSLYGPNETFAPTVDWVTIRILFTLGMIENWKTASIDFKSAFTQSSLPEPIFLELPPGYASANPHLRDKVIKVNTSLYGDRRAANLWYKKIAGTLTDSMNFETTELDSCLFIRKDCIIVLYVDDAILLARDDETLSKVKAELAQNGYDFSGDGDFNSYLGIKIDRTDDGSLKMSQPHLCHSFVDSVGMSDASPVHTPSSGPLFRHLESEPFDNSFNYRSAVGMLQYLGQNTRPDLSYAITSCARYCNDPRKPHGVAIKRIARYLKQSLDEGVILKPDLNNLTVDCHVDADFAGNWNISDPEDPNGVKSRTGFLLTFGGVPLLWKSRVQDHIALSTMESEYIALSTAMRSLVHVRALLKHICARFNLAYGDKISTISTVFEDNRAAKILATTDPPRLTPRSKSLAVRYHWFRSHIGIKDGTGIQIMDVQSSLNRADWLTKSLAKDAFLANRLAVSGW